MMIRQSLLYLPAQIIGPLMQLVAMVVWTHLVSDHTLGVSTLVIATHELLQLGFIAWWSQFALRFFGRFTNSDDAGRFYRTENAVLAASLAAQSLIVVAIDFIVVDRIIAACSSCNLTDALPVLTGSVGRCSRLLFGRRHRLSCRSFRARHWLRSVSPSRLCNG